MDRKEALQMIDTLIAEAKGDTMKQAISDLRDVAVQLHKAKVEPLVKAIEEAQEMLKKAEEMEKIDPKTKLPGTMLDKSGGAVMGGSLMNMNPNPSSSQEVQKMDPASAPPMEKKQQMHSQLAQWMGKCMGMMKKSGLQKDLSAPSPNPKDPAMNPGSNAPKPPSEEYKQKSAQYLKNKPVKKDDAPHPAGSPEDKAHDIVEEGQPVKEAVSDLGSRPEIKKMFEHLRSRKDQGKDWERSPENREVGKSEDKPEDMSAEAKRAITEPADKPMKIQPERPGQANKPSKE